MNKKFETFIKSLSPPIALDFYRHLRGRGRFVGEYASWAEARQASQGYESDLILSKVRESLTTVINGGASFERDASLFYKPNYWWPLLAGLLWVSSRNGNRLNLVDFGGSLGTTYYHNLKFISHLPHLQWSIVEQGSYVDAGRLSFENEHIKFYRDMDECIRERHPDVILFSGVIQYLEKPYDVLEDTLSKGFNHIIFDRTPFLDQGENDRITVQKALPRHEVSYPAWFFNLGKFLDFFSRDYELIVDFDSFDKISRMDLAATSRGFIFQKRNR